MNPFGPLGGARHGPAAEFTHRPITRKTPTDITFVELSPSGRQRTLLPRLRSRPRIRAVREGGSEMARDGTQTARHVRPQAGDGRAGQVTGQGRIRSSGEKPSWSSEIPTRVIWPDPPLPTNQPSVFTNREISCISNQIQFVWPSAWRWHSISAP